MDEHLKKYKPAAPPPGLKERVLDAVEEDRRRSMAERALGSWRFWVPVAAALVLSVGLFVFADSIVKVPGATNQSGVTEPIPEESQKSKVIKWVDRIREVLP